MQLLVAPPMNWLQAIGLRAYWSVDGYSSGKWTLDNRQINLYS